MKGLFVDTAGWMACADAGDLAHRRACAGRDRALEDGAVLVTSDFVVDETLALLRLRIGLPAAEAWWKQLHGSSRLRWERITIERFERARLLFFRYRDKAFSFTDCTRFAVMQADAGDAGAHHRPPLRADGFSGGARHRPAPHHP